LEFLAVFKRFDVFVFVMLAETVKILHDTLVGKRCLGSLYDIFLSL